MKNVEQTLTVMGISPGNPHFKPEHIAFTLDALLAANGGKASALVFISDVIDEHNYLACGYNEKARGKALSKGRHLKRVIHEICARRGYSCGDEGHADAQVRIVDWNKDIANSSVFLKKLAEIETLYRSNAQFRKDTRRASSSVIDKRKIHDGSGRIRNYVKNSGKRKCIDEAVNYILKELTFISVLPALFHGEKVDYVYHKKWRIYEKFIAGIYDSQPKDDLGFRVIKPPGPKTARSDIRQRPLDL